MPPNDSENSPPTLANLPGMQTPVNVDNDLYQSIFEHMLNGVAYCKLLFKDGYALRFYLSLYQSCL